MELVAGVCEIESVDRLVGRLSEIGTTQGCVVVALDARYLVGREHVEQAVTLADRAFRRGENVAEARAIEVLLYAAGRRQIDRALDVGISAGEGPIVVVVARTGSDRNGENDETDENDESGESAKEEVERTAVTAVRRALEAKAGFEQREVLGEYDEELVRDFFAISEVELAATDATIAELVCERVALLDVEK